MLDCFARRTENFLKKTGGIIMELMEGLLTRRSVRKYRDEKVPAQDVEDIVKAGMFAPSARNQQAWEFIVADDKEHLQAVSEALPTARMAKDASFVIVLCADPKRMTSPDYWIQDCAAAMENMLLACHAKGAGGVWIGTYPKEDREQALRGIFNIPADVPVAAMLVGGYPADALPVADRFVKERIHKGQW